ncbi:MAG: protease SohB [Polycyclovorans sp.]|nr:protease SohB [Polycyclovorans sp.]MEC8848746.1 protease SohB [Pseudomonadota bacterium]
MTEFLMQYGLFAAKAVTVLVVIVLAVGGIASTVRQARQSHSPERLEVRSLNERFEWLADSVKNEFQSRSEAKAAAKARKKKDKALDKAAKLAAKAGKKPDAKPRVFVLDFDGNLNADANDALRDEISAVLQAAQEGDAVLLRLESPGGLVHAYGLAASQLQRIRDRGLTLTVAVDKMAASGGYLMACVANDIISAPFAVLGSIGVVAQVPNVHRLLKKHDVDVELHTAGAYKRTLTVLGENTDAGRAKFKEELELTHDLFKSFVAEHRPQLDIDTVATGEHWYGQQALALKLTDKLQTSDDWLLSRVDSADLIHVRFKPPQTLSDRLSLSLLRLGRGLRSSADEALQRPQTHV